MMRRKKDPPETDEPAQPELVQRVDALMSTEDAATAPQLPPQLLKTIGQKGAKSSLKIIKDTPDEPQPESEPAPSKPDQETAPKPLPMSEDPLADPDTDQAVRAIVAEESDMQLAVVDAFARQKAAAVPENSQGLLSRFFTNPWTWLFIIGIAGVAYAWYH